MIQLVYLSAATQSFDAFELTSLLSGSRIKNESLDITGMLVYHEGSFLQVLEGADDAVDALYHRIARDHRHTACDMLLRLRIVERDFGDWSMGFANTSLIGLGTLPGFKDFFGSRFSRKAFVTDPAAPHKLLLAFRDGELRRRVETGEANVAS